MNEELHGLVGLYVLDALDDDERAMFEAHLEECDACTAEVSEFRATTGGLSQLMAEQPPASLRSTIMDRVATTPQVPRTSPPDELAARRSRSATRFLAPAVAVAAAVVALVLGLGWLRSHHALDRQE